VEEEVDESIYWLELFEEVLEPSKKEIQILIKEAHELPTIVVASIKLQEIIDPNITKGLNQYKNERNT
jgi:hypothetical protein